MVKKNQIIPINDNINIHNEPRNNNENKINTIDYYLKKDIPFKKSKEKISNENFIIPKIHEYYNIININYNLQQLKQINKFYDFKFSGNKDDLKKQIYNYMYYSYQATIIQKVFKRLLVKKYILCHGPGFLNKTKCANDCDFCTLDNLNEIPYNQFISFKDEDNFIYGFDINSLYNLYIKNKTQVENPFNKKLFSKQVFNAMVKYIKLSKILNINIDINFNEIQTLNESKKIELRILKVFQTIDSLGNYTNMSWFTCLNKYDLIKFIRELNDIWNYRANLSQEVKREIVPPYGNPFRNINLNTISSQNINNIKKNILAIMEDMINKGINNDAKCLGCYYILTALTIVNNSAAEAMPWLYESVQFHN
tara:strand:- start:556 stop:1653 length:1098 start_codon:yes stop_codon:yes gene_type:complete